MSTEIEGIERALDTLLAAMAEEDGKRVPGPLRASPLSIDVGRPIPTRSEMEAVQLVQEPIYFALRQAVRRLGQYAFAVAGGTDGMRDVAERVADMAPARYGQRLSAIDSAWDGLGSDTDRWIA